MSQEKTISDSAAPAKLSRRDAMQWVLAAVAASAASPHLFAEGPAGHPAAKGPVGPLAEGYGGDPNLIQIHKPGSFWPLTLTPAQRKTATALADVIIPKDKYGPAASDLGVVAMLDEWISAPYPEQKNDRPVILDGLAWIEAESGKRFSKGFADLSAQQHRAICDDICYSAHAKGPFKQPAHFFARFRSLIAGAYYCTPAGWDAIGYVGNVPLPKFEGPPKEVLEKLGLV